MAREGYYNNGFGGRDAQERRGPLLFLLDSLLTLLSERLNIRISSQIL